MIEIAYLCITCLLVSATSIESFFNIRLVSKETAETVASYIADLLDIQIITETSVDEQVRVVGSKSQIILSYSNQDSLHLVSKSAVLALVNTLMLLSLLGLLCFSRKYVSIGELKLLIIKQLKLCFFFFCFIDLLVLLDAVNLNNTAELIYLIRSIYNLKTLMLFFFFFMSINLFERIQTKLLLYLSYLGTCAITIQILLLFTKSHTFLFFLWVLFGFTSLHSIIFMMSNLLDL